MVLPKTERPSSKLGYFRNTPMFVVVAVTMAIYVVARLLFLHWGEIQTPADAAEEFIIGTLGCYLGICLIDFVWDALFY
ncbi:hypothetical protein A4G99_17845 [Haladaptatus sp. R4]|uniref:hypothetical protein n=1 Tax=Haladaptatus sp. R4 TaxID=1679489 RepID=UPI0007B4AC4C|nr:hypothetical protein [Haladaptatus sp. R4]KZN22944.1 hypothetical protein A4G99_17845 [Haladaptatus sp. R4]